MSDKPDLQAQEEIQPVVWRRRVIVIVVLLVGLAIAGRVAIGDEDSEEGGAQSGLITGLAADGEPRAEREEPLVQKILPYVTEAGTVLLLGMILGIGARMAIKSIVVVAIVGMVGIQFAIYQGWISAENAGGFVGHMSDYVFNIPKNAEGMDLLREKAPSVGAGLLGFVMGLKKG